MSVRRRVAVPVKSVIQIRPSEENATLPLMDTANCWMPRARTSPCSTR
ncbi:MAG: hypothetical protein HOG33_08220 [Candidatus Marinimicrobia bacterium]|nr:hypothetical protein [Candidatus Neomarinimicrobiota bacterium]